MTKAYSYIRFSTKGQIEGRSLQRQLETARKYAEENGLELQSLSFQDLGVSGFKGRNSEQGALSQFIEAVKEGTIPEGSWLLLESFDRMSRQPVEKSMRLLMELVELGIIVVTLMDKQVYRRGQLDMTKLIISLVIMSRAHEESAAKSKRLADVWHAKQAVAHLKPLGTHLPAWLEYNEDKTQIQINYEKAVVVRYIFELSANGYGRSALIRKLNSQGIAPIGSRAKRWHLSYVTKLLNNTAVLGEYIPHVTDKLGQRVPTGEVIENYYPPIIEKDLWLRAKAAAQSRKIRGTGAIRRGHTRNILSGMVSCECGSSMQFVNKGSSDKGGYYLVCSTARHGAGCQYIGHRYYSVQWVVLIALQKLLHTFANKADNHEKEMQLEGELVELDRKLNNLINDLEENGSSKYISAAIRKTEQRMDIVKNELLVLQSSKAVENDEVDLQEITLRLNENFERLRLHQYLKRHIANIVVYKNKERLEINLKAGEDIILTFIPSENLWQSNTGISFSVTFDTRWG
ncbi:recombinase family protein [Vibrio parahaemolyticus]|nr:recombinase family protein [Vibrio parahaemolyticus]HCG7974348.1 recombinase family protein [Vibrio parahaemolyticus]